MVNYNPTTEWDKHCDNIERVEQQYICENRDNQSFGFDEWSDKLLKFHYVNIDLLALRGMEYINKLKDAILFIDKNIKGYSMFEGDELFALCEDFPKIDALDNGLAHFAKEHIEDWKIKLEG